MVTNGVNQQIALDFVLLVMISTLAHFSATHTLIQSHPH